MKDKLKQLQLGNYVFVQDDRLLENNNPFRVGKVSCISIESIKVDNKAVKYYSFEFIPITDEWLFKLGFYLTNLKENLNYKMFEHKFTSFKILIKDGLVIISNSDDFVYVTYVHEIQNFFSTCFKIIL
jgi:hypothetical protein